MRYKVVSKTCPGCLVAVVTFAGEVAKEAIQGPSGVVKLQSC